MASSLLALFQGLNLRRDARIAVLGMGNELNGDDAAGVLVARRLLQALDERGSLWGSRSSRWLIEEAGLVPESFTGPLRRFGPEMVLLVDAAEMGLSPGEIALFDWSEAGGMSASTHTQPPSVLGRYLTAEFGCRVMLVGIQPAQLRFGQAVSPAIQAAVDELVAVLIRWLDRA